MSEKMQPDVVKSEVKFDNASKNYAEHNLQDVVKQEKSTTEAEFQEQKTAVIAEFLENPDSCYNLSSYCTVRAIQAVKTYDKVYSEIEAVRLSSNDLTASAATTYLGAGARWKKLDHFFLEHADKTVEDLLAMSATELQGKLKNPADVPGKFDIRFLIDNIKDMAETEEQKTKMQSTIDHLEKLREQIK